MRARLHELVHHKRVAAILCVTEISFGSTQVWGGVLANVALIDSLKLSL